MKIFISGKWTDKESIRNYIFELQDKGFEITHDWTTNDTFSDEVSDLERNAVNYLKGVEECDVHIFIFTDEKYPYRGTFTELGYSLALRKKILFYNPFHDDTKVTSYCTTNTFYWHPSIQRFNDWNAVVAILYSYT